MPGHPGGTQISPEAPRHGGLTCHIATRKKSDFWSICFHINQLSPPLLLSILNACCMAFEVIELEQCDFTILILIVY
ncbi:hypothetical protein I79_002656 [Cricetulus griseus]|uniref:Uncharacterized protein n=1 Tax=Cricetulus griseus TaxID=10029 RepID=G3GY06_CRIGR|nr:hypothetical protein I79_002656 [Cricetulus griseus]